MPQARICQGAGRTLLLRCLHELSGPPSVGVEPKYFAGLFSGKVRNAECDDQWG